MTVTVHRHDGNTDRYLRFGDSYRKRHDGTLDVLRVGAGDAISYAENDWADVEGDEKRLKIRFWRSA